MPAQATAISDKTAYTGQSDRRFHDPEALLASLEGVGNPGILRGLDVIRPVHVSTDMLQVLEVFRDHKQEHFFPVLDSDMQPMGLVCERSLKGYVYSRYGMALLANQGQPKLLEHFLTNCPVAELDAITEHVLMKVHIQPDAEGVIITWKGSYVGFLRARALVELAHEQQLAVVNEHTARLDARNREIQSVLQNMRQGICIIQSDLTLNQDYSSHLTSILALDDLAGKPVMDLLFTRSTLGADQRQQVAAALMAVLEQDVLLYDCNAHHLPAEITLDFDGERKLLELHWRPLVDDDDCVERLMLVVRDITQIRALQLKADEQQREMRLLEEILAVTPSRFVDFIQQSCDCVAALLLQVSSWVYANHEGEWQTAYRDLHTIKGNARTLGLLSVTDSLHASEQAVLERNAPLLHTELKVVMQALECYRRVHRERLSGYLEAEKATGTQIEASLLAQLEALALEQKNTALTNLLSQLGVPSLRDWLLELSGDLPRLARELDKPAPVVSLSGPLAQIRLDASCLPALAGALTHIMRNSMDHGIEPAEQRVSLGKPEAGQLQWHGAILGDEFVLQVGDDGRGLNLKRLAEKARQAGIATAKSTTGELAELIFHAGISTAEQVSMTSGRGVGMDAVRASLEALGGGVSIELLSEQPDAENCAPFRLHLHLPQALVLEST